MIARHILIVDDDEGFSKIIQKRLESEGYRTSYASSGKQALALVSAEKPDIIILDLVMAPMDGVEVYKRLKAEPENKYIPVIFVSDNVENPSHLEEMGIKVDALLAKPYDPDELLVNISNLIDSNNRELSKHAIAAQTMGSGHDIVLSDILVSCGLISQEKVGEFLRKRQSSSNSAIQDFIAIGVLDEKKLFSVLADKFHVSYEDIRDTKIEQGAVEKVPPKYAWYYKIIPLRIEGDNLVCAIADPLNIVKTSDDLGIYLKVAVRFVLSKEEYIMDALKKFYGVGSETVDKILSASAVNAEMALPEKEEDIAKLAQGASVIKLVNQILVEAQEKNATDVHIEPYQGRLKLRYRIDGILHDVKVSSEIVSFLPAIISRIKIMSGLNIVERRLPQDGRAKIRIKDEMFDLRISTLPSVYGESIVIRVLPKKMIFSLQKLGLAEKDLKVFESMIAKPHGIIFVTGPTGSGKRLTLYAALNKIRQESEGTKILTIEDPVEYELDGIIQLQVNPEIGLTFARALRSMLRHDPDIMMVGEVRDFETAEIAIRMALTGHLLFSTLHTNDAASGIARLLDIGVEPYLVSSAVEAFIGQRLVRVICDKCIHEVKSGELATMKNPDLPEDSSDVDKLQKVFAGQGCKICNFTGYRGRTAIYEMLVMSDNIRKLIQLKASASEIKKQAIAEGMRTIYQCGLEKIEQGITTIAEVLEVT